MAKPWRCVRGETKSLDLTIFAEALTDATAAV
jgi:hypothetical protein